MVTVRIIRYTALVAVIGVPCPYAAAQGYPTRPIRAITTDPGASQDLLSRVLAQELPATLGEPLIVDNRTTTTLPDLLAKAPADGYTIGVTGSAVWLTPLLQKTPYDPVKDFAPVTLALAQPYVLVVAPSLPVKSIRDLIDLAKAKPGTLNIGAVAAPGGQSFLSTELFKAMSGANIVRVPYKGNPQALVALLAGETNMMFNNLESVTAHTKSGKLRALAITTLRPSPLAPELPTMSASGLPGYESIVISGILVPAGTPPAAIARLNHEIVSTMSRPEVRAKFPNADVIVGSPEEFAAKIKSESAKWAKVLHDAGVQPEM
jgi:tripartite-type tricarboxylate transporter receptor subunit TctC